MPENFNNSLGWGPLHRLGLTPVGLGYLLATPSTTASAHDINYLAILLGGAYAIYNSVATVYRAFKRKGFWGDTCLSYCNCIEVLQSTICWGVSIG